MLESEFQESVLELAHLLGWKHLHVRRTIGRGKKWTTSTNRVGWPDLLLWKAGRGFVAIELKVHPKKATPEQVEVLAELEAAGARTMVAYPEDLDDLKKMLTI